MLLRRRKSLEQDVQTLKRRHRHIGEIYLLADLFNISIFEVCAVQDIFNMQIHQQVCYPHEVPIIRPGLPLRFHIIVNRIKSHG